VGPHFERTEARRLERVAELALDPHMHATGPLTVGNGNETTIGTPAMQSYTDIVRERPSMIAVDASLQRMQLVDKASALTLALDAANSVQPQNALEKMLIQQATAAHVAAMQLQIEAQELLQRYKRTGYIYQQLSIEAGRIGSQPKSPPASSLPPYS
jgi:hypothetical protein